MAGLDLLQPGRRSGDEASSSTRHRAIPAPHRGTGAIRSRVAIIIDDVGGDLRVIERASSIPYRLTFAVIPHLAHSVEAANLLDARGYQVMLHLPMEPLSYPREDPGRGAVLSRMAADEIRSVVLSDLAAVPHVRGVNNHMGSRITADAARMRTVLQVLRTAPVFFIDSRTTNASIAHAIAREERVPSAERSVFLDDVSGAPEVRRQLQRLLKIASERGSAIAIGHPHPETLDVLAEELPELARKGVEVVFASELTS